MILRTDPLQRNGTKNGSLLLTWQRPGQPPKNDTGEKGEKMATKRLPYFRWYPADAIGDDRYASFTDEELGFFHRLINFSWINFGIDSCASKRCRVFRISPAKEKRLWAAVGPCFKPDPDNHDKLLNPRQEEERLAVIHKSETNAASARTRYANAPANAVRTHHNTRATRAESESESVFENLGSKENLEIQGGAGVNPFDCDELEEAWERHHKHIRAEPKDLAFRRIVGMNGTFDLARFRDRHRKFCEYWDGRDWNYCALTFLGWVEAGMPNPPPAAKAPPGTATSAQVRQAEFEKLMEIEYAKEARG